MRGTFVGKRLPLKTGQTHVHATPRIYAKDRSR